MAVITHYAYLTGALIVYANISVLLMININVLTHYILSESDSSGTIIQPPKPASFYKLLTDNTRQMEVKEGEDSTEKRKNTSGDIESSSGSMPSDMLM